MSKNRSEKAASGTEVAARDAVAVAIRESLESVDAALYGLYVHCVELDNRGEDQKLQAHYEIALNFLRARELGSEALVALTRAMGYTSGHVGSLILVAERIDEETLVHFKSRRTPAGRALSFSHLVAISALTKPEDRRRFADLAAANNWPYSVLEANVQAADPAILHSAGRRPGAGRPHKPPASPAALIKALEKTATHFDNFLANVVAKHSRRVLEEAPPEQLNDALLGRFASERARLERISAEAQEAADLIAETLDALGGTREPTGPDVTDPSGYAAMAEGEGERPDPGRRRLAVPA